MQIVKNTTILYEPTSHVVHVLSLPTFTDSSHVDNCLNKKIKRD